MKERDEIGSVTKVSLTVLVDNKADLIVENSETVKYFRDKPLLAEHGFSVLIQLDDSPKSILWDAGVSEVALIENMRRMEIDPKSITKIALSHGHRDHYAAITTLLKSLEISTEVKEWDGSVSPEEVDAWMVKDHIPLVAHPAAFRERWGRKEDGTLVGPFPQPPIEEWEAAGARIILSEAPYKLAPGCWTTGYVPRKTFEENGIPKGRFFRDVADFIPDNLEEDQAIVINVKDKGLVVLSGCAHAGIVNTVNHAKVFTGIDRIHAVIGGFHLARASDEDIEKTVQMIKKENPEIVVPGHCTGFRAISRFAQEMPDKFIGGVVGTTYLF